MKFDIGDLLKVGREMPAKVSVLYVYIVDSSTK